MDKFFYYLFRAYGLIKLNIILADSYIYSLFVRRFPDYFENKDREKLLKYCPEMGKVLDEMDHFYKKVSPTNVSYQERKDKNLLGDKTLTYGESTWMGLIKILNQIEIKPKDVFYDLGSGSGKIIFLVNKKLGIKTVGIDKIEYFIKISNIISKNLDLEKVKFKNSDFFTEDISNGTIFYMTATCFDEEIMQKLSEKFKKLRDGSIIISITRTLKGEHLKLFRKKIVEFGWAKDTAYFYRKI